MLQDQFSGAEMGSAERLRYSVCRSDGFAAPRRAGTETPSSSRPKANNLPGGILCDLVGFWRRLWGLLEKSRTDESQLSFFRQGRGWAVVIAVVGIAAGVAQYLAQRRRSSV
jgi:hypothetical protein